jgi:hypothetical protein
MARYLTMDEIVMMHAIIIQKFGGHLEFGIEAHWNGLFIVLSQAITPTFQ